MNNILTNEDIQFLKELANELKTQDRLCTGKPVIYQIREEEMITGIDLDYTDNHCLIDTYDGCEIYKSVEEAKEYFNDYYEHDKDYKEFLIDVNNAESLSEIYDVLESHDFECWYYTGYDKRHKYSNFFLTKKALDTHVKQNHYHYKNPDYFINHAWRNPELQRLLEIVEKFA